jgi:hypothetical protein
MSDYAPSHSWKEWGKFAVFKLGNTFGFPQPALAAIVGCLILFLSWVMLPGTFVLALDMPVIGPDLPNAGLTPRALTIANWVAVAFGTYMGACCWCRVAVLTHPKAFDRYKIKVKGIPF